MSDLREDLIERDRLVKLENFRSIALDAFAALDRGEGIRLGSAAAIDNFVGDILKEMRISHPATSKAP